MQCLQLTRGEPPVIMFDVALSGDFHRSFGYVKIDRTEYTSAQTLTVVKGTSVTVHCGSLLLQKDSIITLNGTTVAQGTADAAAEYTFAVTDNCSIVLSKTSQTAVFSADITMPA